MSVLDRSQRARVQKFPRIIAAVMSLALLAPALEANRTAEAVPAADPMSPVAKVASRPDLVSAVVTARAQGSRVEVEALRTETSTTWAEPSGLMTTEAHAAPIRFKTASGAWRAVDLTLQKGTDGTVAPRGHQLGLQLGKRNVATGQVFASATAGTGRQVEWLAPWKLPEPTIDGTKATYADIQPGVDLTLDARRSGFETDFIIKQRPATAPVWRIPLRTKELTARQLEDGTIEFVDAKNVVRSRIPVAYMWDSVADPATKDPVNKAIVNVRVEDVVPGTATLVIAPDPQFVLDPARVFPLTVDPTYANMPVMSSFDTFVQSGWTNDLSSTVDLRVGKNGTTTERSFLNFPTAPFIGKDVIAAHLSLMQYGSTTCTPTQVNLHSANPATPETRWAAQPTTSIQVWGSVSAAKGFSAACAADRVYIPMTGLAQFWAGVTYPTAGVALKAANEADANAWKRFYSTEGPADPYISLTWNRPPNPPATAETTEAIAYAAPGDSTSYMYSASLRPWVRTKATDADGNTVKYVFEFFTGSGETFSLKGTCTSSVYASGTTAGCRPSQDLPDNTLLYIRAKANDGRVDGPWTSYQTRLRTGTQVPAKPEVNCPAPYTNGSWQDTKPTADVTCTITATGTSYSAPGYVRITVPSTIYRATSASGTTTSTPTSTLKVKIQPSSDPAVANATITFDKNSTGLRQMTVQAETPAGKVSPDTSYSFGWGSATLSHPAIRPRVTTTDKVRIEASGPPRGQSPVPTASMRWRLSGYGTGDESAGWNTVDPASAPLTVDDLGSGGVVVRGSWDTSAVVEDAHVDADPETPAVEPTKIDGLRPVLLDVQVCLEYGNATQCTWSESKTNVMRVPHAFGGNYPSATAGPGEVALWTGEFRSEVTDFEVPGYTGRLALTRTHATFGGATGNGLFGPGWTAQLGGNDVGAASLEVIDNSRVDGTIVLADSTGPISVWRAPSGKRRTTASFEVGEWIALEDDGFEGEEKLVLSGTGASTVIAHTDSAGVVSKFEVAAAPAVDAAASFRPVAVDLDGQGGDTVFGYDVTGRLIRLLAPAPPGVSCSPAGTLWPGAARCGSDMERPEVRLGVSPVPGWRSTTPHALVDQG
ncbi:DNRLRE domain-containing protein [Kribbella sp. NPDC023972]|uniref:DNRLRE domain-containing protein n=1 Tax=Kribbella sp. NPDC023972 TaxID=3154795 RepID=UPI0033D858AE